MFVSFTVNFLRDLRSVFSKSTENRKQIMRAKSRVAFQSLQKNVLFGRFYTLH